MVERGLLTSLTIMELRQVGGSGLRVSRFALGTMTWGDATDAYDAEDQLTTYLEVGGTTIDLAPVYGRGNAEALVGSLISKLGVRNLLSLTGKAGIRFTADGPPHDMIDGSRGTLLAQLDQTLADLGTDHLDLWQIHRWDPTVPLDEVLSALEYAVTSGRTRYVGISNFSGWQTTAARLGLEHRANIPVLSSQVEYSLLRRGIESEIIPALTHHEMSALAWSPLTGGVLSGKYRGGSIPGDSRGADPGWEPALGRFLRSPSGVVEAVVRAAEGLGVTPAQVALAWIADRPRVATAILGARAATQLAENLEADEVILPDEIVQALDDVSNPGQPG